MTYIYHILGVEDQFELILGPYKRKQSRATLSKKFKTHFPFSVTCHEEIFGNSMPYEQSLKIQMKCSKDGEIYE